MDAINWLITLASKHQKLFREMIREQRHPRSRDLEVPEEGDESNSTLRLYPTWGRVLTS